MLRTCMCFYGFWFYVLLRTFIDFTCVYVLSHTFPLVLFTSFYLLLCAFDFTYFYVPFIYFYLLLRTLRTLTYFTCADLWFYVLLRTFTYFYVLLRTCTYFLRTFTCSQYMSLLMLGFLISNKTSDERVKEEEDEEDILSLRRRKNSKKLRALQLV